MKDPFSVRGVCGLFFCFVCVCLFVLVSYINRHLRELQHPPPLFRSIFIGTDFKGKT